MKLECIGFYTLSDSRAQHVSMKSDLQRCELILTDKCNFKCPYCRGIKDEFQGSLSFEDAKKTVKLWTDQNLQNIRFSGGEPTLWKDLLPLVEYTKFRGVKRIAISTNGSANFSYYEKLVKAGVNDFSISLDACCSSTGDKMAGVKGTWNKVIENIKNLSKISYTTVGVVLTPDNLPELEKTVEFASSLGVSDVRIIPSAQWNGNILKDFPENILAKYPILKYRVDNLKKGKNVRSITKNDTHKCYLVLDDMAVLANKHFPCIIYMREQGLPIGEMTDDFRQQRLEWFKNHNAFADKICRNNCLDVCVHYNNTVETLNKKEFLL